MDLPALERKQSLENTGVRFLTRLCSRSVCHEGEEEDLQKKICLCVCLSVYIYMVGTTVSTTKMAELIGNCRLYWGFWGGAL